VRHLSLDTDIDRRCQQKDESLPPDESAKAVIGVTIVDTDGIPYCLQVRICEDWNLSIGVLEVLRQTDITLDLLPLNNIT